MNDNRSSLEDGSPGSVGFLFPPSLHGFQALEAIPSWGKDLLKEQAKHSLDVPQPHKMTHHPRHPDTPPMYSTEFFGKIGHHVAQSLLVTNGSYLIREGKDLPGSYILSIRFMHQVMHFKLYFNSAINKHYVKERQYFNTVHDLVKDGLYCLYLDVHYKDYDRMLLDPSTKEISKYTLVNKRKLQRLALDPLLDRAAKYSTLAPAGPGLKEHNFKTFSIKGMNWCAVCANLLWRFMSQGTKCADCGLVAHRRCIHKVPDNCGEPRVKTPNACFGIDLSATTRAANVKVPWIVEKCIEEIEYRGMYSEGLYRVSGYAEEIEALKIACDTEGPDVNMSANAYESISVIAGVLKLYLRSLPTPLINLETFKEMMKSRGDVHPMTQITIIRESLLILPEPHYFTLKYLALHLCRVAKLSESNKMSIRNIATVFCPSVMPLPTVHMGSPLPDMTNEIDILATIISLAEIMFFL